MKYIKMKVSKKDLKNITVEVNKDGGFTVWVLEKKKVNGKTIMSRHWIIDGSTIMEDGIVDLGRNNHIHKVNAKYTKKNNSIKITRD
tara:strand:+ start:493 stop:753 length:261 start_codon:yes stop_codon:yes gene_type:complete